MVNSNQYVIVDEGLVAIPPPGWKPPQGWQLPSVRGTTPPKCPLPNTGKDPAPTPPKATPSTKGTKHDCGKRRYDLMPELAEGAVVDVLTFGATKYGDRNWEGLERLDDRCFAACRRHLARWREGEHTDPETGLPHVAHAIVNLIFILEKQLEAKSTKGRGE